MNPDDENTKTAPLGQRQRIIASSVLWLPRLLASGGNKIGLEKLDGPTRAKVLAALAGLVILWLAVIALIWLAARVTRRYMRSQLDDLPRRRTRGFEQDDWAKKPMTPSEQASEDEDSDET